MLALGHGDVDVALFTNGAQVDHLFAVGGYDQAAESLRLAFKRLVVASVGPVCTQVLEQFGIRPDIEPSHPKMGLLVADGGFRARRARPGDAEVRPSGPPQWR